MKKEIDVYSKQCRILVKSKFNNKHYILCYKNGQLFIEVFTMKGNSVKCIYEITNIDENFEFISFNRKPKVVPSHLYHNKTVIYNNQIKCIIKKGEQYFVNWYREEKGKPMTSVAFTQKTNLTSLNDFLIGIYNKTMSKR